MDKPRPDLSRKRKIRRIAFGGAGLAAVLLITLGLSRLAPAAPQVEKSSVWVDVVKRGPMLRQTRGLGTLVPEEIRWIPATTEGRLERILVHPGATVTPSTVIMELSNPELELQALDAESLWRAAEAQYTELKVRLESQRLDQKAAAARVKAEYEQARMRADADEELYKAGIIADITRKISEVSAGELANRDGLEKQRLDIGLEAVKAQLAVQRGVVNQRRAEAMLRRNQVKAQRVVAGIAGVLQQLPLEVGQRVTPGMNLARVAEPGKLKAVIRVPETQAKDVLIGQPASIDTRNGVVPGRVSRIDPAVQNGTVTVDIVLEGTLPQGARPDLSVDGTIELERLSDVVYVGRPAQGQAQGQVGLFKLSEDGATATRVPVKLGRTSVSTIEVVDGLKPGDQVILSDTSAWDSFDRLRIN
jgi:HlyD family secretion protein